MPIRLSVSDGFEWRFVGQEYFRFEELSDGSRVARLLGPTALVKSYGQGALPEDADTYGDVGEWLYISPEGKPIFLSSEDRDRLND